MPVRLNRWSLSLIVAVTLALGVAALVHVPESYSLFPCHCPSFWESTKGWGKASNCDAAEQAAVADATANANAICSPDGVCDLDPNYTITGACREVAPGMFQVDVQIRFKCLICLDEPI